MDCSLDQGGLLLKGCKNVISGDYIKYYDLK